MIKSFDSLSRLFFNLSHKKKVFYIQQDSDLENVILDLHKQLYAVIENVSIPFKWYLHIKFLTYPECRYVIILVIKNNKTLPSIYQSHQYPLMIIGL